MKAKISEQRCDLHQENYEDKPDYHICLACKDALIVHLRQEILNWKDAWYKQREATGVMAWEIPSPFSLTPEQQEEFLFLAEELKTYLYKRGKLTNNLTNNNPNQSSWRIKYVAAS